MLGDLIGQYIPSQVIDIDYQEYKKQVAKNSSKFRVYISYIDKQIQEMSYINRVI